MTDDELARGPYVARPYGRHDESGTVYKIGPRGGLYFIARYHYLTTARSVASTLNALHELERK